MAFGLVARRVDHVNLKVPDPAALFETLSERLGLPVYWPPTTLPGLEDVGVPGFEIAAVGAGNMHLEPTRFAQPVTPEESAGAGQLAICLEPAPVEEAVAELERRGISHSPPVPYDGEWPQGSETEIFHRIDTRSGRDRLWTWIFIGGLLGEPEITPHVFCCEFRAFDLAASRERAGEELRRRDGGPLGVRSAKEIVIVARDPAAEAERWTTLLDPARPSKGAWRLGDGPAIRLRSGGKDRIEALVLEVASLERARAFLERERMLGASGENQITIDPAVMQGVEIRLTEL